MIKTHSNLGGGWNDDKEYDEDDEDSRDDYIDITDMSPEEAQVCAALPDSSREQVAMAAAYGGQQTAQTVANRGLRRTKSSSKEESTVYMW